MHLTLKLKIEASPEAVFALKETVRQYTASFNRVVAVGWERNEKNGVELHKLTYRGERERTQLPSSLVCSARVKATEAVASVFARRRRGQKVSQPVSSRCAIRYDAKSARIKLKDGFATLASIAGRQAVSLRIPDYHRPKVSLRVCSSDLCESRKGELFLHVVVEVAARDFVANGSVVGVDFGVNRPAVTSDGDFLGDGRWRDITERYLRLRRALQSKGTRSARRHLKRLAGKVNRFRSDCDHVLAKRLVESVGEGTTLVVENLTGIRKRIKVRGRSNRRRLHAWSFHRLKTYLAYKAELAGVLMVDVDPRDTSRKCSACGHTDKANRTTQSHFACKHCGFSIDADLNAARNIRQKYLAYAGMTGEVGPTSTGPSSS